MPLSDSDIALHSQNAAHRSRSHAPRSRPVKQLLRGDIERKGRRASASDMDRAARSRVDRYRDEQAAERAAADSRPVQDTHNGARRHTSPNSNNEGRESNLLRRNADLP